MLNLTLSEQETAAYLRGDTVQANMLAELDMLQEVDQSLNFGFTLDSTLQNQIDKHVTNEVNRQCPDYEAYKAFFEECFCILNGHYPCPSVTSDYDCSVVFDAITNGDIR